jgi:transcriptional regulator with XRE-family HTH domain
LRENRRKCGFSQEKLAEKAEISPHYLAMLELTHSFPAAEVLERLANALNNVKPPYTKEKDQP